MSVSIPFSSMLNVVNRSFLALSYYIDERLLGLLCPLLDRGNLVAQELQEKYPKWYLNVPNSPKDINILLK